MSNRKHEAAELAYELIMKIPRDEDRIPLTLEGCIRHVILKSPDMFKYRDDALGILFCTLGTGIDWKDGRLSDVHPNNYLNPPPQAGGQGGWSFDFGLDDSLKKMDLPKSYTDMLRKKHEERSSAIVKTIETINDRCQQYRPEPSWYPISWYACNLCAPADAQEDFFLGCIETATLICNYKPTPGTERWIVHQRTKSYAEEILVALKSRKRSYYD